MRWNAQSHNSELQVGARLYLMEALYVPGSERPDYTIGDHVRLGREGFWHANTTIIEVRAPVIVVEDVDTKKRYELEPTTGEALPDITPDLPFEDYTIAR